jgi:monoamine oxidase
MKHTKTGLFHTLRKAFFLALQTETKQTETAEIIGEAEHFRASRRRFLHNLGAGAALAGLSPRFVGKVFTGAFKPSIAIIGGGMAGLNALHTLKENGLDATVFEASGRTGGRIFTVQEAMGQGTWAEFGAEFIDSDHKAMWELVDFFGFERIDYAQPSETALHTEAFYFNGRFRTLAEVVGAFRGFAVRMKKDMDRLPETIDWQTQNPFVKRLDQLSLSAYLEQIGATGWIKRFIEVAYESEYGLSPQEQSSLNLLLLISPDTEKNKIELFGSSDERYKIKGGNQKITDALSKRYENHIQTGCNLESLRQEQTGVYTLYFSGKKEAVKADYVVLTLPFTRLRQCELRIPMPPRKLQCIMELGYGTNAKLMLGMESHFWREQGYTGLVYADNGIPNGWDNAQLQTPINGPAGLSILFGGQSGINVGEGSVDLQKEIYLKKWNQIFPGAQAAYNGKSARMHWPTYPYNLGSYICYKRGQYTHISGWEAVPVGQVLFAGEHCGGNSAGFMNGAAQSGKDAAMTILGKS